MFAIPGMMLTRFGRELPKLSNDYPPVPDDCIKRLCEFAESQGLKARKVLRSGPDWT
jgi:hypothetical protein